MYACAIRVGLSVRRRIPMSSLNHAGCCTSLLYDSQLGNGHKDVALQAVGIARVVTVGAIAGFPWASSSLICGLSLALAAVDDPVGREPAGIQAGRELPSRKTGEK